MRTLADLDRVLRDEVVTARDLLARLATSRATLSRLVQSAGPRVRRLGATRSVRYTRTREIPGLGYSVPVTEISPAGAPSTVGRLHFLSGSRELLVASDGTETLFEGLPPFAADMSPQGYLGRTFAHANSDLGVPTRLADWTDNHRLLALALRGDDTTGNRIIGEESLTRWLRADPVEVTPAAFPSLAQRSADEEVGSSAGGEQPKFSVFSGGRHVLVKFAAHQAGEVGLRWRDLLIAESLALQVLAEAGVRVPRARWFDDSGFTFLEVERFDRAGRRGRIGVISLWALDNEFYGHAHNWSVLAQSMRADGSLSEAEAQRLQWLDLFGALIANDDRHLGNVSFFTETGSTGSTGSTGLTLAPVYDMLPMLFAPSQTNVSERAFTPVAPTALTFSYWHDVARAAEHFWERLIAETQVTPALRVRAEQALQSLQQEQQRHPAS